MDRATLKVEEDQSGIRLDVFVSQQMPALSRSQVIELIKGRNITVNDNPSKPSYRVSTGDTVEIQLPPPRETELVPQDLPVTIIYQDNDLAVIDKPRGMVVHPAHGNWDQTLVNALLYQIDDLSGINGELRPGIVHRMDKDTSGLLVIAKNDASHRHLSEQIKVHSLVREYTALAHGNVKGEQGKIDAPIGRSPKDRKKMAVVANGRPAVTNYRVEKRFRDFTLIKCRLETGRTHQIRVHMAYLGNALVGDPLYGPRKNPFGLEGQALHASFMELEHPVTGESMRFDSPLPDYFTRILTFLIKG
ncbi:MAG: RluA family pseudouridine synthase [Chitinophagales bacterium]